MQEHQCISKRK